MKINRDNYEAYFLDYFEGQLSPGMVKEVLFFVEHNPDLKHVFDDFEAVSLIADEKIIFEKKSSLKKNQVFATSQIDELNYEEYLIGETEGLLTADQIASLDEFITINPQFEKDRKLFALTHLATDKDIVFEAKESLKQKAIRVGKIDAESYDTFMARELEGDLNPDEKRQLAEFLQYNPHLERDRKLYAHTILSWETDIVFENKNSLKQTAIPFRRIVYYALSAAAALALIFSVYFLLDRNNIPQHIAQQDNIKNKTEIFSPQPANAIPGKQVADNSKSSTGKTSIQNHSVVTTSSYENAVNIKTDAIALNERKNIETVLSRPAKRVTTRSFVDPQFTFIRTSQMYMNQHLEFYYNLKLAEQIEYAQVNSKDKSPAKTILNAATDKADEMFALNRTTPQREEKKNLSLWTFAELGVQTFNTITSSEIELNLRKDETGKVVAYGIEGSLVDFEKEVKR